MRIFWQAAAGTFVGRLVYGIFAAVCGLIGIGPESVIKFVVQGLPEWFTPSVARGLFLSCAVLTAYGLAVSIFRAKKRTGQDMEAPESNTAAAPAQPMPKRSEVQRHCEDCAYSYTHENELCCRHEEAGGIWATVKKDQHFGCVGTRRDENLCGPHGNWFTPKTDRSSVA